MRLMLEDIGGWVKFPETMHEFYAHLAEMIGSEKIYIYSDIHPLILLLVHCFI